MEKITVKAIIEIAGFPKEHVEDIMKKVIDKLKEGFNLKDHKIYEAVALKDKMEGFWSTFSEVDMTFKDMNDMIIFCFEYMPSSIEILNPGELNFKSNEMNNLFNDLLSKLHHYDMVVKNLTASNQLLKKQLDTKA